VRKKKTAIGSASTVHDAASLPIRRKGTVENVQLQLVEFRIRPSCPAHGRQFADSTLQFRSNFGKVHIACAVIY